MKIIVTILFLIALVTGCDSPTAPDCLKTAGETTTEIRQSGQIVGISTNDGTNVLLTPSVAEGQIVVEGPKNVLGSVSTQQNGDWLFVETGDKCAIFRSNRSFPTIKLPTTYLWKRFNLKGFGTVRNDDTLRLDTLRVEHYGTGNVDLTIKNQWFITDLNGIGDFKLSGQTDILQIFTAEFNRFNSTTCQADDVYVYSRGEQDIKVRANKLLYVSMEGTGSVFYEGDPSQVIIENRGGSGKVERH